jgi:hypothetical protein
LSAPTSPNNPNGQQQEKAKPSLDEGPIVDIVESEMNRIYEVRMQENELNRRLRFCGPDQAEIIQIVEKLKEESRGRKFKICPIDMLKYVNVRRHVTSSFKAVTRDAWDETHASKTKAPELGRYRPKL